MSFSVTGIYIEDLMLLTYIFITHEVANRTVDVVNAIQQISVLICMLNEQKGTVWLCVPLNKNYLFSVHSLFSDPVV